MDEAQTWVVETYNGLADLLAAAPAQTWDAGSLCSDWQIRHVIAHATMPARLDPDGFRAEMAAAGGDFTLFSNTVASRDAKLAEEDLLADLRSSQLHDWRPPGGGEEGAVGHSVIHSLDCTIALGMPSVAPLEARVYVLDGLTSAEGAHFGIDLSAVRLLTSDADWSWGTGEEVQAESGDLVALLGGRTLPDGRSLPRA